MSKSYFTTKKLITLALLSAIGTILMLIEIPSPIFWLKFDLSDVVVYLSAMIYGPIGAIVVAFIKSVINFLLKGSFVGVPIDQVTAFIASLAYALPLYYLTKLFNKRNNKMMARIMPLILSSIIMTIILTTLNYWITDLYLRLSIASDITKISSVTHSEILSVVLGQGQYDLHFQLPAWIENSKFLPKDLWFWFIVITYIPFNLVKSCLTSITYFFLSYRLDFLLKRYQISDSDQSLLLQLNQNEKI